MRKKTLLTAALMGFAAIALAVVTGSLSGKWKGSVKDPDGNDHDLHLVFNVDRDTLTGTAQGGGDPLPIQNGKVNGNDFSFKVTDPEGNVIPASGSYIAQGDSVSLNFEENGAKFHATLTREDQ